MSTDLTRIHERIDVMIDGQVETKVAIAELSSEVKVGNIATERRLSETEKTLAGDGNNPGLIKDVDRLKQLRTRLVVVGSGGAGLGTIGLVIAKALGYL